MRKPGASFCALCSPIAAVVAAMVLSMLVRPAATLDARLTCPLDEHQHEDVCFSVRENLRCQASPHVHSEACRDEAGMRICGMSEYILHIHQVQCYDRDNQLRCSLPERITHTHAPG